MRAKVILVDGPGRGQTIQTDSPYQLDYIMPLPVDLRAGSFWEAAAELDGAPRTVTYHIRKLAIFGELLLIGSIADRPRDFDLFDALASAAAKDAVLR